MAQPRVDDVHRVAETQQRGQHADELMKRIGRYDESRIASSEFFSRFANVYCERPIVPLGTGVRDEGRLVADPEHVALEEAVADFDGVERVDDLAIASSR